MKPARAIVDRDVKPDNVPDVDLRVRRDIVDPARARRLDEMVRAIRDKHRERAGLPNHSRRGSRP